MENIMRKKRSISFILVTMMVLSMLSLSIEQQKVNAEVNDYAYLDHPKIEENGQTDIYNDPSNERVFVSNGGIIISSGSAMAGVIIQDELHNSPVVIKGNGTDGVVNVILDGVNLSTSGNVFAPLSLENNVTVNMKLKGSSNSIRALGTSAHLYPPAIKVASPNAITFSGFNGEMGTLKARSKNNSGSGNGYGSAAIGGYNIYGDDPERDSGPITITDGASISAIIDMPSNDPNSRSGAGIGAGYSGYSSKIEITGGHVYASSYGNCGIGGETSDIKISGGTVIAKAQENSGVAIGGAASSKIEITGGKVSASGNTGIGSYSVADINISGGDVTATGGKGAGIGSRVKTEGKGINISGGKVSATSYYGAGIGGGDKYEGKNINISGGVVSAASALGAGIGGGLMGTGSAISISGGFVTATLLDTYDDYFRSGIGCGADMHGDIKFKDMASDIFITGGSVVINNGDIPISTTPEGFESDIPLNKVDIPFGNGINPGNQDLAIEIKGTPEGISYLYKAKTVKSGSANEHGTDYKHAATAYLPEGTHELKVSGKKYGILTVDNNGMSTVTRTVFDDPVPGVSNNDGSSSAKVANVTKVYSPNKNIYLKKGKSITLPVVASATDSKNPKLIWSSSNKKIATVNQKGKVTAKKKGKVKITVKAENGNAFTFTVNVVTKDKKVKKIAVKGYSKTMKKNQVKYLKVTLNPKAATNGKITFKSSKKSVVAVDKAGRITAMKAGKAKITVKAGGKKKVITINVKK